MAQWTTKILKVLGENLYKGELKSKWEITRAENDEGKHFSPGLQKTGFYKEDGEVVRGYPQPLTVYDLRWIRDHWAEVMVAIDPPPAADSAPKEPEVTEQVIEDTPF